MVFSTIQATCFHPSILLVGVAHCELTAAWFQQHKRNLHLPTWIVAPSRIHTVMKWFPWNSSSAASFLREDTLLVFVQYKELSMSLITDSTKHNHFPLNHVSYSLSPITNMPQFTNVVAPKSHVQSIWKAPQLLQTCLIWNKHRGSIQGSNYLRHPQCSIISPKCQKHIVWGLFNRMACEKMPPELNSKFVFHIWFLFISHWPMQCEIAKLSKIRSNKIPVLSNVIWLFTWSWHRYFIVVVGVTP